jgi:hypothetical protein
LAIKRQKSRKDGKDLEYRRHTITTTDEDWESIRREAERQGLSVSNMLVSLYKQQFKIPSDSEPDLFLRRLRLGDESRIHLKYYRNWYKYEHERDWGQEMWECENLPSNFYFLGSDFFVERVKTRYYSESDWEMHARESKKYHERFIEHMENTDGFMRRGIISIADMKELASPDSRFRLIDKKVIIDGLEVMKEKIDKYWRKADIALLEKPANFSFEVYQRGDRLWGSLFGDFIYADTTDLTFLKGLIYEEFPNLLSKCSIRGKKPVIDFLSDLIEKVDDRDKPK